VIDVGARADRATAVFERELRTLARNRLYVLLAAGFAALIVAIALGSDVSGYVPLVATLLTPIELLVPVLAAALGYRSILGDRERGELDVLRTYPATREEYVVGVFLGRLVAITATVIAPLLAVGVAVPVVGRAPTFLPQPSGLDSPVLYLRFVVLTALFAAALLAVMTLLSAVVAGARRGLVLAVVVVVAVTVGVDAVAVFGLATGVPLEWAALPALSPNGAYRGLVLAFAVAPVSMPPARPAPAFLSALSLFCWTVIPLLVAALRVWPATE